MPVERRTLLRRVLTVVLLAAGALLAVRLGDNQLHDRHQNVSTALFAAPELHIRYGRSRLSVDATTASADHEAALLAVIADQYDGVQVETNFRTAILLHPEWETITTRILYLIAATASATAAMDDQRIHIRGITYDQENYQSRLQFLRNTLVDEQRIESTVITIDPAVETAALCERHFASIVDRDDTTESIRFPLSSTTLSGSALPLLDRLAEFAYDCRDHRIAIVGYTDATGPADWNLKVSATRARAVAAELVQRGVAEDRLIVEGRGSQSPLADNNTVQGRALNRRIEFELR